MKLKFLLIVLALLSVQLVMAQRTITGTVTDIESEETLIGATVTEKGTTNGTITDVDGNFSLQVADDNAVLTISYTGYTNHDVPISGQSRLDILLQTGALLDEVVVTALGLTKSKERISYAAQTLKGADINQSRVGDISQQLSGQVAGLNVITNNGSAVSSSRIVLRGESSLNPNKNQPLLVVDGVLISNEYIGIGSNPVTSDMPVDYGNSLNDLNTDDFESVTVLKGPKAAALYGERGTNGVLVITTKSGKNTEGMGIEFNTGISTDVVNRFWDEQNEYGGGGTRGDDANQYRSNWGGSFGPRTDGTPIAQATPSDPSPEATPFLQRADRRGFFDTGVSFNNNLALSFSEGNAYGRVSLGRLNKTGIVPNTDYERSNVGIRMGIEFTEKLSISLSSNYVNSNSDNVPTIGYGGGGLMNSMLWTMKNFDLDAYEDYWLPNQEYVAQNYFLSWGTNPHLIVNENLNGFNHNRFFGNIKANYQLNDNLSAFVRVGGDSFEDRRRSRRAPGQPAFRQGMYREQDVRLNEFNVDGLLSYTKDLTGKISFTGNVGASSYRQTISNKIAQTNALAILGVFSLGNAADTPLLVQNDTERKLNSTYATMEFSFDDKLFVDVSGRNDWSSTLAKGNQSFFYPAIGFSAVASKMVDLPSAVTYLKFRGSFAQTGNSTDPGIINNTFNLGVLPGSVTNPSAITDPNIKSENTTALEIGVDLRLFRNRVKLDIDLYNYNTTDQILRAPISAASGTSVRIFNAGEIQSRGAEVLLTLSPIRSNTLDWTSSFNFATSRSEVIELADGIETLIIAQGPNGGTIEARPGGRMGDLYGRGFERSPNGDIIYDDIGGFKRPRLGNDIKKLGNYNPDWSLGFNNRLRYNNFSLNIFLDYRSGGDFYTLTGSQLYRSGTVTESLANRESDFVPEGVVENGSGGFIPNTETTTGYDWYRAFYDRNNIEANTYDATFLKLREISIGVDLASYFSNANIQGLRLSVFGRNLATWTKTDFVRHFDPEVLTFTGSSYLPGFEIGQLPGAATFGFNLGVTF